MKHRFKNFVSLIIAVSMLLSLIPLTSAALDDEFEGLETLEEIPFTFELEHGITQSEAKALVDAAADSRYILQEYYENHMRFVQGKWAQGEIIESKELSVPIPNSDNTKLYITLMEHLLPGGSYERFVIDANSIFTKEVAERYCEKYYGDNNIEQFIIEDGVRYIKAHAVQATISFLYSQESSRVELINSSKYAATAKVFCEKIIGYDAYPMCIECKFIRTDDGWRISESSFADMMCSFDEYDYTLVSSPSTADPSFDSFVLLPAVSLACLVPAFYLLRRRRRRNVI